MILVRSDCQDPYYNLALEEYLFFQRTDLHPLFFLWQNSPTIVVGRNQNTLAEINRSFVEEKSINVVRRLSGGGAVYHDLGNLNFTFILQGVAGKGFDFARYTRPVIKTLRKLGVQAEDNGRNDITIDGKKFSGNAQYRHQDRLLHHGTLLFNTSLEDMVQALTPGQAKLESKGIASVRSRVTNLIEHLPVGTTLADFQRELIKNVLEEYGAGQHYFLSAEDEVQVEKLSAKRYRTWEWNYAQSPACNLIRSRAFPWGQMEVHMDIQNGIIQQCFVYGDFFTDRDIKELCALIEGSPYMDEEIRKRLQTVDLNTFIPGLTVDHWLELILS
ncbi:MAG TPA: lipoate--protein ligase [Syntrophomonadaceae bacterium]|nr:lipoate--protein ligase [Syntrophomonadaceae bacterium]